MFIDIKRYKGKYQIDENGNVKSLNYRGNTKTEHLLKPMKRGNGYLYVDLYDFDGKCKLFQVYRAKEKTTPKCGSGRCPRLCCAVLCSESDR